jgi:hypothetical protein
LQVIPPEDDEEEGRTVATAGHYDSANSLLTVESINPTRAVVPPGTSSRRVAWVLPCMIALAITVIAFLMTNESSTEDE